MVWRLSDVQLQLFGCGLEWQVEVCCLPVLFGLFEFVVSGGVGGRRMYGAYHQGLPSYQVVTSAFGEKFPQKGKIRYSWRC